MWKENKPIEKVKNLKRPQKLRKTQCGKRFFNVEREQAFRKSKES